jgi:hypothetical protein
MIEFALQDVPEPRDLGQRRLFGPRYPSMS